MLFNKVAMHVHVSSQRGGAQRVELSAGPGGSHQMARREIPQNPVTGPGAWDRLDRRLSVSGSLKRGRVSWGGGRGEGKGTNVAAGEEINCEFLERGERMRRSSRKDGI